MDQIINWLLLVIIFVFDPLAIALVIAANFAFEQLKKKTKENVYGEQVEQKEEEWDEDHAMDMVLNDMVNQVGDDLFEEPQVIKEYIKLPGNLKGPLLDTLKHARRRGENVPSDAEIDNFF